MNLKDLFWMQRELDEHILKEQRLKAAPFLERILAFIVETGECANEWKGFKYWKIPENRKPNREKLLEEYVDKLHFILSLGISMNITPGAVKNPESLDCWKAESITEQFILITGKAFEIYKYRNSLDWISLLKMFMALGEMLGFTWEEIEAAYLEKNAVNHSRQVLKY